MGSCLYGESNAQQYTNDNYSVGVCSMQGSRKSMEDSYCVHFSIQNHPTYSLFGVFDGFKGNQASQYLSNNLLNTLNKLQTLSHDKLIIDAVNNMDKNFLKLLEDMNTGSTVVFALIKSDENENTYHPSTPDSGIFQTDLPYMPLKSNSNSTLSGKHKYEYEVSVFWIGDSRSVLIYDESKDYDELTVDHHCTLETERKRIIEHSDSACIINGKIDGHTELSRSFGCYSMKSNNELKDSQQKHVCTAEITHIVCQSGDMLLLHSDGLTAKWNEQQMVAKYKHHYEQSKYDKNSMKNTLTYLCEECIDEGSRDNITVIAVKCK